MVLLLPPPGVEDRVLRDQHISRTTVGAPARARPADGCGAGRFQPGMPGVKASAYGPGHARGTKVAGEQG